MENEVLIINREEADVQAEEYFSSMCGFNRDGEKYREMFYQSLRVRERISACIDLKAVVSDFPGECIKRNIAYLNGVSFECRALEQLNVHNVCRIYAYILTSGNIELKDASLLDVFYADTWGTAYIDAGRDILKKRLHNDFPGNCSKYGIHISDSFGPGYYGMDVTEVFKFFKLLEGSRIGVELKGSGMMSPVKSCAGFFIKVMDDKELPTYDCRACIGNSQGCRFCRAKNISCKK